MEGVTRTMRKHEKVTEESIGAGHITPSPLLWPTCRGGWRCG
jgi:hypothetical protein